MSGDEVGEIKKIIHRLCEGKTLNETEDVICHGVDLSFSFVKSENKRRAAVTSALLNPCFPMIFVEKQIEKTPFDNTFETQNSISTVHEIENDFNTSSKITPRRPQNSKSSTGDVEGSPLRMKAYADLSDSVFCSLNLPVSPTMASSRPNEIRSAVPVSVARAILSAYAVSYGELIHNERSSDLPSLMIFCDGKDKKRTACVYAEFVKVSENDVNKYVGLKTVSVSVRDPAPDDVHLPKIQRMNFGTKQILFKSSYDTFRGMKEEKFQAAGYQGSLLIEVEWEKQPQNISLLQQPPIEGRTKIKASVTSGDMRSAAYVLYRELEFLKSFITGLCTHDVVWLAEKGEKPVLDSVKELIEHLKLGDSGSLVQKNKESSEEMSAIVDFLIFEERKDLDFVDHLWKVLKNCTCYSELVECLQYVFKVLISGELQPFIRSNNNTTFAQLVRESYAGKLRMPNLAGTYAMELLAEMGSEKLHQDYAFAFLSKDFATLSGLKPFLQQDCELSKKIIHLEKMHNILEMVVMLKTFLSHITHDSLVSVSKEMLMYYEQNAISSGHTFTFSLPTSSVKNVMESCPPCSWRLKSVKMVDNIPETQTILLVAKQPFSHLEQKQDFNFNNTVNILDKENGYFYVKVEERISILV